MKTIETLFIGILAVIVLASCQDDAETVPFTNGETANVTFELDASALHQNPVSRTFNPSYSEGGYSIYAFKQVEGGTDYVFTQQVTLNDVTFSDTERKLNGNANLPIGNYKFLSAYGIVNQSPTIQVQNFAGTTLGNDLSIQYTNNSLMNEVFLSTDRDVNSLTDYDLGLNNSTNPKVTATLTRAVGRVDIMFISGTKGDDGKFTEQPYVGDATNIFDDRQLEQLELRFAKINPSINMFGKDNAATRISRNLNLNSLDYTNATSRIVIGNGGATAIGEEGYAGYDNVQANDIISGGAHIFGTYLFPYRAGETTDLDIYIKPVNGTARTISISEVPVEQNRVTLVKVYVLKGNHVFSTNVEFEVTLEVVWGDPNHVDGSIS